MKLSERNKFLYYSLLFLVICLLDQISKHTASLYFPYVCNRGISFGLGQNGLLFSLVALIFVLWFLLREKNKWQKLSLVLILGAGSSNLLDRLFYGCVRDFINIGIIPTFNIADAIITLGVILLLLNVIMRNYNET